MRKFKKFYIEITNVCNLACKFCPKTKRKAEFMDIDTFSNILDEIKPYAEYIYFHVKGEPLLHPKLDKLLDISYEKGFKVNITTNGTLISKVKDKLLDKPSLRQINFSLHSFDGNDNNGNKEDYINSIIDFAKEAVEKSNIIIAYRLWNLEKDNNLNLQRKKNNYIIRKLEEEYNLSFNIEEKIPQCRGIKIDDRVYLNQDHEFVWPDLNNEEYSDPSFCYGLRTQIAVLVDGTVVPCCLDGEGVINLGNIKNHRFSQIIEGERARRIVEGFNKREAIEELCRKCGYRTRF